MFVWVFQIITAFYLFTFRFEAEISLFTVFGSPDCGKVIESQTKEGPDEHPSLYVYFEKNPLDLKSDTKVIVKSRPLQIVYDSVSETIGDILKRG